MSVKSRVRAGRVAGGLVAVAAFASLGGGVANAAEDGTIQEIGHTSESIDKATGVAQAEKEIDDATGVTTIDDETGVTKLEEDGLGET